MILLPIIATLCALIYQAAFAARPEGSHSMAGSVVKTASTTALAAWGLASGAPGLVVLGLALGAAGDLALSRPGKGAFLAGMAAFAAGHLAYAVAFGMRADAGVTGAEWVVLGLLVALILSTEVWLAPRTGDLRWPVRGYGVIIGLMAATVVLLSALPGRDMIWIGVALFVLSDTLLAIRLFVAQTEGQRLLLGYSVWHAYWVGQVLILIGAQAYWAG
jgi:uncharacterized membrane protein YhhN